MRRFSQQFRSTMLIPISWVVLFGLAVLTVELIRLVPLLYGVHPSAQEAYPFREMSAALVGVMTLVAAVMYGFRRAGQFHPLYHASYFRWLKLTPWTWRQALPLGPVRLVW